MIDLQRLLELSGGVNVTIQDATTKKGIDRKKADRILDPHGYFEKNKHKLKEYLKLVERAETLVMYHGTSMGYVSSILKDGLLPAEREEGSSSRWASLGGVYLTSDFNYAIKMARRKTKEDGRAIAIIVVKASTRDAAPDQDNIEDALLKAYADALDMYGVDSEYKGDLDAYAEHEEQRPLEDGDKPFERHKFFKGFWNTVMQNMSQVAGSPRRKNPDLLQTAVSLALELHDQDTKQYVDLNQWQKVREELSALYPRLRSTEQHAKSGLNVAHSIRLTKPVSRKNILAVITRGEEGWKTIYGDPQWMQAALAPPAPA